jgi:hypothetical protein
MEIEARNAETNLMLLCFMHHAQVDDHPDEFPVEALHQMKAAHERWIAEQLAHVDPIAEAAQGRYNGIINSFFENLNAVDWGGWSMPLTLDTPRIGWDQIEGIEDFNQDVITTPWPGTNKEFEASAKLLAEELTAITEIFKEHGFPTRHDKFEISMRYDDGPKDASWYARWEELQSVAQTVARHMH